MARPSKRTRGRAVGCDRSAALGVSAPAARQALTAMPFGLATEPDLDGWDWRMVEAFARSMGEVDDLPALKLLMDEADDDGRRRFTGMLADLRQRFFVAAVALEGES